MSEPRWSASRLKGHAEKLMEQERFVSAKRALALARGRVSDRERAGIERLWLELNGIIIMRSALGQPLEKK